MKGHAPTCTGKKTRMTDNVNHPAHYETGPFECIELTEQFDFCVGNAIKYVWRHNDKGKPVEDLSKALWYVQREIDRIGKPSIYVSDDYGLSARLAVIDFAHMADFWYALNVGDLDFMKKAIQSRLDTLTKQEGASCHES